MKKLKIYEEKGEFVFERINEFDHSTKCFFATKEGLTEYVESFKEAQDMSEYKIEVDAALWSAVITELQK
jgi:hypothetical protein